MMKRFKALLFLMGLILLFASVSVFADTQVNVLHAHNGTGRTVNDVEVYLNGNIIVSGWLSTGQKSPFKDFSYVYDPKENMTILRWYNGKVAHCERADYCIMIHSNFYGHKYLPRWSIDGVSGEIASPALSYQFKLAEAKLANMTIANTPTDGMAETIGILQIGPAEQIYTLKELTWDNLEKIKWSTTIKELPLKVGSKAAFSSAMPSAVYGLVFRAKIWIDKDPDNVVEYVGQYIPNGVESD
jgi:hypothetical protein